MGRKGCLQKSPWQEIMADSVIFFWSYVIMCFAIFSWSNDAFDFLSLLRAFSSALQIWWHVCGKDHNKLGLFSLERKWII